MAVVISNRQVSPDFYLLETECTARDRAAWDGTGGAAPGSIPAIRAGQFCMLRSWDRIPVLSRPISIFDADGDRISFLYKTVGRGTAIFSQLKPGDSITVQGPLGRGFPDVSRRVAMVGGGAGIAPFYLGAKQYRAAGSKVDLYLGFSGAAFLTEEYRGLSREIPLQNADKLTVNVGGFITDDLDPAGYDAIFTCGPEIMMKVLWEKCKAAGVGDRLFVSLESRMACGVGACYGCSRKTTMGNKKVCKDGPVFPAAEVFDL
ncbi:dihydroorotate dehydrogenase electron transfer subunit [Treponema primitia]|uniref:dihydroorotate dehydrogenase electron transfer subunit n=1 Tax=Treponema primitia TaxID=88058 RepID=UPI00398132BF